MNFGKFKLISLLLIFVFLLTAVPAVFAAGGFTINVVNPVSNVDGEGYYDNTSAGGSRGFEASGKSVCFRASEWAKYSLSGITPGRYTVFVSAASTGQVSFSVDINDEKLINKADIVATGNYVTYKENNIGTVEITKDSRTLTFYNVSGAAAYVNGITLTDADFLAKKNAFNEKSRPYKMAYLPCKIEAENFDAGISGVAYSDIDTTNAGMAYRTETGIDIYNGETGGYYVKLSLGEWTKYTFRADKTANYRLYINCLDCTEESKVRIFFDGHEIVRTIKESVMPLGKMREAELGSFKIPKGTHAVAVLCLDGEIDFDYLRFASSNEAETDLGDLSSFRSWDEAQSLDDSDYETEEIANKISRELYVKAGALGGDGTKERPYGTVTEARDFVRTINGDMDGDIVIHISGEFNISETIELKAEDSGSNGFNVVYDGGGETVISGGRKVTGFKRVEGTPLYQTYLPDIDDFRQFYIGENRGVRSKSKWLYWMVGEYDDPETNYSNAEGYIISGEDFPQGFAKPEHMEMIWMPSWKNIRMPIKSIEKTEDGDYLVKYPQPYFDSMHTSSTPMSTAIPYYLENAPEFLDEPGEFYFDKDRKILTYYPTEEEDMDSAECYIPVTEKLLAICGNSYDDKVTGITIKGISFCHSAWEDTTKKGFSTVQADALNDADTQPDSFGGSKYGVKLIPSAVSVDFADRVFVKENEFSHNGAVALSINKGSSKCEVTGNLFDDNSATSLTIGDWRLGASDGIEKFTRKIKVTNNLIRRSGVEYMTPVIAGYHVNSVTIDHNDILDAPYTGISMGWGWGRNLKNVAYNKIMNNKIENVLYKLKDGGHIYTLDAMQGSIIKGNYMIKAGEWKGGIYHDNSSSYITSTQNVFEDCPKWLKITWSNIHDNVAFDNYSERPFVCTYPAANNIQPAHGKVNGEWPEEAKDIIANAGLSEKYKYLYDDYEKKPNTRNSILERQPYAKAPGYVYEAGRYMDGGEGVAYHEILGNENGMNVIGEPGIYDKYDGTGMLYIMVTIQGEWIKYKINVEEEGDYDIFATLTVAASGTAVTVDIDDEPLAENMELEPNCDNYSVFSEYPIGTVHLTAGEHIVRFEHAVNNFGMESFRVCKAGVTKLDRGDGFIREFIDAATGR